tara:strand:+ start:67 stop:729 length:663 start_codon:yes stop_codon:yes gene_type:complete
LQIAKTPIPRQQIALDSSVKTILCLKRPFAVDTSVTACIFRATLTSASNFSFYGKIKSLAMYAVLKTGGKQYKVSENDVIIVERLSGESGAKINLDNVLMIGEGENTTVGTPIIEGALVAAEVLEHKRGDKITVFKKKRRKNYRRTMGHRQELTVLRITDILTAGEKKPPAKKTKAEPKTGTPKETESKVKAQTKADTSKADGAKTKRTPSKKTAVKKEK